MTESVDPGMGDKLAVLQQVFKLRLIENISEIDQLWKELQNDRNTDVRISSARLYRIFHGLAGAGGTFGAIAISRIARELELKVKPLVDGDSDSLTLLPTVFKQVDDLLEQLRKAGNAWLPSNIPYLKNEEISNSRDNNLIYLAEDDALLASDLVEKLKLANYDVRHFIALSDFEEALSKQIPAVIIMDIVFKEGGVAGANIIRKISREKANFPPVIFISVRDDVESRLAAARAGARRYFCKPLDTHKLISTIDGLTARIEKKPYRILLIDDDENLLECYETILERAGMIVKAIPNPLDGLSALINFKPDIVVTDVYMPECSGPELAQVIRQDDTWALIPIMFLSTETDLNRQLDAMNLGGDDFLVKPVDAEHLVSAVVARAKRSRWTTRLNRDLVTSLRESEFQLVTMNQHNIVSTTDLTGKIISVNQKFCEISGYSRNELLGRNHSLLKSGLHPKSMYQDMWQTISEGKVWHGTICNLKKNGEEYWVESTIVPFLDENGKPYKYVSTRTNVTAVRENEERLRRSQVFANIGTWDWNIRTGGLYWSDLIWPLFGYKKEQTKTTYENFLSAVHPDDRQMVIDAVNNCVENGAEYNIEHRVVWSDGSEHWVHESGDVLRDENNKPLHMLGVVQSIDGRIRDEQELVKAREEAESANHAKSQFLSSMSHELRTPMNAIMGYGQLLRMDKEQPLSESQQESISEILKASSHLVELIDEVLDLSKIEAGRLDLTIENVLLDEVIAESLQLVMPMAAKRSINISLSYESADIAIEQLPDQRSLVQADRKRLKQVLLNLLSNAVKYNSDSGKIIVAVEKSVSSHIIISVSDTGAGLTREQQFNLFNSFDRLGAEDSDVQGTGIGLVITKKLVENMGGSIGVNSQSGNGSTFWIKLQGDVLSK
ncbi:MAG: PAS domain-containing protein [Gammaproteobacteria bacterium]|nr:PAS domain-containing protein [Gammaproteobacteria bacterium]